MVAKNCKIGFEMTVFFFFIVVVIIIIIGCRNGGQIALVVVVIDVGLRNKLISLETKILWQIEFREQLQNCVCQFVTVIIALQYTSGPYLTPGFAALYIIII